jgi:hypothetical protein
MTIIAAVSNRLRPLSKPVVLTNPSKTLVLLNWFEATLDLAFHPLRACSAISSASRAWHRYAMDSSCQSSLVLMSSLPLIVIKGLSDLFLLLLRRSSLVRCKPVYSEICSLLPSILSGVSIIHVSLEIQLSFCAYCQEMIQLRAGMITYERHGGPRPQFWHQLLCRLGT